MKTGAIETLKANDVENNIPLDKKETTLQQDGAQIQIHVSSPPSEKKKQKRSNSTTQVLSEAEVYAKDSIIRQNLLGPLSFDDLYYT
ncbi:hypothetical protein OESDEN_21771 [Oesophagostomum dentatum]|uniref:Uncharacterized protein n=1 Tax=Oesophagostomum dentatum TaxID=61180 RepID=A0A0B1S400_OESDE|nr:hypothetical protein OESDEN_21771 [Oesophagostomum dentatum]